MLKLVSGDEIHLFADKVLERGGAHWFLDKTDKLLFAAPIDQIHYLYAASVVDGRPVAVQHWIKSKAPTLPKAKSPRRGK